MKKLPILFIITFIAVFFVGKAYSDTVYVNVMNNFFDPASFSANTGDVVKWTLMQGNHTTTSSMVPAGAASWDYTFSGVGDTYVYEITHPGSYGYDCTFHPGMSGTFSAVNALPLIEEFDYTIGSLLTANGWTNHSGTGQFLAVQSGSLTYPSYPSSGIGNHTLVEGGSGSREDAHKTFAVQSTGSVYASFLVTVNSAALTTDYFLHFGPDPISTIFRGRVFIQDNGSGGFNFGLSKASTSTVSYTSTPKVYGQTYLLVLKYEFVGDPTGSDDIVKLYVNPALDPTEPAVADVVNTDTGSDIAVGSIALRQGGNTYSVQVDGIRVTNVWSEVLPVELTSFTGRSDINRVVLNWATATEVNNSGFEVERKSSSANSESFNKIGFVDGHGTSSEPISYSFVDHSVKPGIYQYRLKQVDFNGTFAYSPIVEVEVISPTKFELAQNFPNPFNPSTKIIYNIPEAGIVKVAVYNLLGELISNLVNEYQEAGSYTVNFNAEGLNSGVYFYRIDTGKFSAVRKMTLIK